MLFHRFIHVLKANLNRAESKSLADEPEPFKLNEEPAEMDPIKRKEAEYYANLELKPGTGFTEVKVAYKQLMKKYHPDVFNSNEEHRKIAEFITSRLNEAYTYFEKKYNK
jgi:DnaJ-domain-containing protein 1